MKSPKNSVMALHCSQETIVEKPPEDAICTQIEGLQDKRSNTSMMRGSMDDDLGQGSPTKSSLMAGGRSNEMLDKQVIEALQNITKEQVRQILEPIFETLGAALDPQVCFPHQSLFHMFLLTLITFTYAGDINIQKCLTQKGAASQVLAELLKTKL